MTWDHHGQRIEGEEEAAERAAETLSGDCIQSALDRINLVWMIDAYAGGKLLLLARIATAGPAVCKLSIQRLARDCNMSSRTVERYRSVFVEDGILKPEVDKGRTVFRIDWSQVLHLAGEGLLRRPVKERVAILESTLRSIVGRNALPVNHDWLARWADPATKQPPDSTPGHFRRTRKKQNANPRQGIHCPRQGIRAPDKVSRAPDTMSGPSEPELNPNPKPESDNATPLDARRPGHRGVKQLASMQVEYAGKPTLIARVLEVLHLDGKPLPRGEIANELNEQPGHVGRALGELCRRGYAERRDHGWYVITSAGTEAGRELRRAWQRRRR